MGYHAYVYYADLKPAPPGTQFSPEWGLMDALDRSYGDWREFDRNYPGLIGPSVCM